MRTPIFGKNAQTQNCSSSSSADFVGNSVTPISTLANNKEQAILLKKVEIFRPKFKLRFSLFFRRKNWHDFVTPFSTLANIKGSLPTKSTTPDRLR
tara:strand:+ start:108 stop:395 length:288 start_codon:yes stop_codon:yes gene_type:complete